MQKQEICELLEVSNDILQNNPKLYKLLEILDYDIAKELLSRSDNADLKKLLENEEYYSSLRDFEKDLYRVLVSGRDNKAWLNLSKDTTLSKVARARAAYLYSFLTSKMTHLSFSNQVHTGFYHGNKNETGNGLARLYGLKNGIDMQRFNQFKMTGGF